MKEAQVSIIMRSFNEAWALRDTLPALRSQDYQNWELIVIDSGSSDGSREIIREFGPDHFIEIPLGTYVPGKVLNMGMERASSDLCVFLNADATPRDSGWLRHLVDALRQPGVGACFGRKVARPDCRAVFAHDYERCFGPERESAGWDHFFSMVSSGLRREVWQQRRFREDIQYAEDDEFTRWCVASGYRVEFAPESVVTHSHNYTPRESYRRAFGDAKALGKALGCGRSATGWLKDVLLGWAADTRRDFHYFRNHSLLPELPHAMLIRWQQRRGRHAGFRAGAMELPAHD